MYLMSLFSYRFYCRSWIALVLPHEMFKKEKKKKQDIVLVLFDLIPHESKWRCSSSNQTMSKTSSNQTVSRNSNTLFSSNLLLIKNQLAWKLCRSVVTICGKVCRRVCGKESVCWKKFLVRSFLSGERGMQWSLEVRKRGHTSFPNTEGKANEEV